MITHTFHQSLIRPNLILGCDRDLFFMFALAAFILVVISQNWTAFFVGLFIWFSSLALLRLCGPSTCATAGIMRTIRLARRLTG